jgi:hypothetical protein
MDRKSLIETAERATNFADFFALKEEVLAHLKGVVDEDGKPVKKRGGKG